MPASISCSLEQIALSAINFADTSFLLHPFSDNTVEQELLESIGHHGILHPPLLLAGETGRAHRILSGWNRLQALRQLDNNALAPALLLPSDTEPAPRYDLLLTHRLLTHPLSPIEQAYFLRLLEKDLDPSQIEPFLPRLGLATGHKAAMRCLHLLSLAPSLIHALHTGLVHPRTGDMLHHFDHPDQEELVRLIMYYQLGGSKQHQLITRCHELLMREKIRVKDLMDRWQKELARERKSPEINRPQETAHLLGWLLTQCQPRMQSAEEDFQRFTATLPEIKGVRVEHALSFEEESILLHVTCLDKAMCRQAIEALSDVIQPQRKRIRNILPPADHHPEG